MKLWEFLTPLNMDTLVAISNVDRPPKRCGRVQYAKLRNIRWEKIRNILEYDIMQVTVHKENGGLFIQVFDREKTKRSLNNWDVVDKYFHRKDQREGRKKCY